MQLIRPLALSTLVLLLLASCHSTPIEKPAATTWPLDSSAQARERLSTAIETM